MADEISFDVSRAKQEFNMASAPNLCAQWPIAKQVLQMQNGNPSPIIKAIIGIIISLGNSRCPAT